MPCRATISSRVMLRCSRVMLRCSLVMLRCSPTRDVSCCDAPCRATGTIGINGDVTQCHNHPSRDTCGGTPVSLLSDFPNHSNDSKRLQRDSQWSKRLQSTQLESFAPLRVTLQSTQLTHNSHTTHTQLTRDQPRVLAQDASEWLTSQN